MAISWFYNPGEIFISRRNKIRGRWQGPARARPRGAASGHRVTSPGGGTHKQAYRFPPPAVARSPSPPSVILRARPRAIAMT
ncbi:hypothetical protein GW17_00039853 [Ensete ventricosum]|nr:hypothetical protein GW17_00039853 [Ensete ventricosum]